MAEFGRNLIKLMINLYIINKLHEYHIRGSIYLVIKKYD